jgi:hypothetical protein
MNEFGNIQEAIIRIIPGSKHSGTATPPAPLGHRRDAHGPGGAGSHAADGSTDHRVADRGRYVNILTEVRPKRHAFL